MKVLKSTVLSATNIKTRRQLKINLFVIFSVLLFNEIIIYRVQRLRWDLISCETGWNEKNFRF